jgi:hypothetical protein
VLGRSATGKKKYYSIVASLCVTQCSLCTGTQNNFENSQHAYASLLTETVSHTKYSAANKWLYNGLQYLAD